MRIVRLVLLASSVFPASCKNEPRYTAGSESAVDRSTLCVEGGATLDKDSNACICPDGTNWTGIRCEKPLVAEGVAETSGPVLPSGLPPQGGEAETPTRVEPEVAAPPPDATAKTPELGTRLKANCLRAHGIWLEKDQYCHCPDSKVLVARHCRTLNGAVSDDACLRSVNKGKWKRGACTCEAGLVFSPSRGGCVAPFAGDVAVMRRVCESSLNKGKWDARQSACQCPAGRLWSDELCQVKGHMSSKQVCESAGFRGTWSPDAKRCTCPSGQFWIDQSCVAAGRVTDKAACESESSSGRWDEGRARCLCPGLTTWHAGEKLCGQ